MGDRESSHTGIDLDIICISELVTRDEGAPEKISGQHTFGPQLIIGSI